MRSNDLTFMKNFTKHEKYYAKRASCWFGWKNSACKILPYKVVHLCIRGIPNLEFPVLVLDQSRNCIGVYFFWSAFNSKFSSFGNGPIDYLSSKH